MPAVVAMLALALLGVGALVANAASQSGPALVSPFATTPPVPASPIPSTRIPDTIYFATGGPFIAESQALSLAADFATGPVRRQEIHLLPYGVVSDYLGSRNHYYDLTREIYLVITSASYEPRGGALGPAVVCQSYVTAVDATTGSLLAAGCRGTGLWPDRVPAPFSTK